MQAIKYGIRSTFRTPGKTALYTLILLLLAVLLSVAFCVNAAVRGYLEDCSAYFHTIVNLEYVGKDYPDSYVYDNALTEALQKHEAQLDALCRSDAVRSFEPVRNEFAQVEGLHRMDNLTYDTDAAVLRVYVLFYDSTSKAYFATISESLYSRTDESGKMVLLRTLGMDDPDAEKPVLGNTYYVCGHFFQGTSSYLWYEAEPMQFSRDGENVTVPAFTPTAEAESGALELYGTLARLLSQNNNACAVQYTACLEDQLPFHQQELRVIAGRAFTEEEYRTSARVCLMPELLAGLMDLTAGDRIRMSVTRVQGDYFGSLAEPGPVEEYEVVGIYNRNNNYPYQIYLPTAEVEATAVGPVNGYRLGQFRVNNEGISDFLDQAADLENAGFRFSVYDQGYSAAVEPMQELLFLSWIFLGICILLTVAALSLQCHMFISRQRETAATMLALGSGRRHVITYFLACSAVIAIPAAALGCVLGKLLDKQVFRLLIRYVAKLGAQDLRFSSTRLSLTRTLEFVPRAAWTVYLTAGLTLLAGTVLFTLIFSLLALRNREKKKKKRKARAPRQTALRSSRLKTRLKYALLSIRRSGVRSAIVLLVAAAVALFFGQLTGSMAGYRQQLEAVRNNTVIRGHATDATGQKLDGLVVSRRDIEQFLSYELVSSHNVSDNICHLRFVGIPKTADGASHAVPDPMIPTTSFGIETLFGQMYFEPSWDRTSSVAGSPRFYYTESVEVKWLEGWSEDSFTGSWVCAIPYTLQQAHGIQLGDTVRFLFALYDYGAPIIDTIDLPVVAVYRSSDDNETIFSPISNSRLPAEGAFYGFVSLGSGASGYDSFVFTLKDARQLDQARQALEDAGFTYSHSGSSSRSFAVIDDMIYLNTTHSMERQIQYVSALYDALYVLTGLLGLALAWLLVSSRRKEIALMRALGTQPARIVGNFFFEQVLLCAAGTLLGTLLWRLLGNPIEKTQIILSAAFFGLWILSALCCVCAAVRKQAYAELTEPE